MSDCYVYYSLFLLLLLLYSFYLYFNRGVLRKKTAPLGDTMNKFAARLLEVTQVNTASDLAGRGRLPAGKLTVLRGGKGKIVTCLTGQLWLTQEGEAVDYVLAPNESLVLKRDGSALITGIVRDSSYQVA